QLPKVWLRATRAAAMPLPVRRKARRLRPCFFAAFSLRALTRASYSFCLGVCGGGMNSSLEAIRLGIGSGASDSASRSQARTHIGALLSQRSEVRSQRSEVRGHCPQARKGVGC